MKNLSILNIFVLFALYNINLTFGGERFSPPGRFTDSAVDIPHRFDDSSVHNPAEQIIPIHIPTGNFFILHSEKQQYKACNIEQDVSLDNQYQIILPLAAPAHIIKDGNTWCLQQFKSNKEGIIQYLSSSIAIQNLPQGFLENKKNQNNFPFYAIDNQGSLYKCEFPESSEYKIHTNQKPSIPQESFIVSSFRKYPNLMTGITGIALVAIVTGAWKLADKLFGTNVMMVAINKICSANYNTKI